MQTAYNKTTSIQIIYIQTTYIQATYFHIPYEYEEGTCMYEKKERKKKYTY